MKRSEAITIIKDSMDGMTKHEADTILTTLEEAGLIGPRYLVPDGHGMFNLHYGWEEEDV